MVCPLPFLLIILPRLLHSLFCFLRTACLIEACRFMFRYSDRGESVSPVRGVSFSFPLFFLFAYIFVGEEKVPASLTILLLFSLLHKGSELLSEYIVLLHRR